MDLSYHSRNAASAIAARSRMQRAGVTPQGAKLWTDVEYEVLRNCYPDYKEMKSELPHRTHRALVKQCGKLGLKKTFHWWTGQEISSLRKLYPDASHSTLHAEFPGRSWRSIEHAALKHGIYRRKRKYKRTGRRLIDDLLARLEDIGWTLKDLDLEAGTERYFQSRGWRYRKLNMKAFAKAVGALNGDLEIRWKD